MLESVREEGQDKAQWNMRMAYGYQYLNGQEEQAIPYAQRWAELDPEDEDAPAVIQQCQKEIDKRNEAADESDTDRTGVFTGFVLLSKGEWDKQQFIRDMKEKWDIAVDEYDASEEKDDDALVFEVGDMLAAVSLNNYPIPGGEAEVNAENNYMWEDAVKVAREHRRPHSGGGARQRERSAGKRQTVHQGGGRLPAARSMPPASTPAAWCSKPGSMRALPIC